MKNTLFKKGLIVGIIILFIGVSVLSSVSSKDVSVTNDKVVDDNNEIEPLDEYTEIVSFIYGGGYWSECDILFYFKGWGIWKFTFTSGDFFIKAVTKNPFKPFLKVTAHKIEVPQFIGIFMGNPDYETASIVGHAIGDIYWE